MSESESIHQPANQPVKAQSLETILEAVAKGEMSPAIATETIESLAPKANYQYETVGTFAKVDQTRAERTGFPEVIWGEDKSAEQIIEIMQVMAPQQFVVMATRVNTAKAKAIQNALPQVTYFEMARICAIVPSEPLPTQPGKLSLITAGTDDIPVAEAAAVPADM